MRRALAGLALLLAGAGPAGAGWQFAHGDAGSSGFADVATQPAQAPVAAIPVAGSFAPGVGPVIGPDGTVYLATEEGTLWALHPDGSPFWHRALDRSYERILSAPAVDSDGSVYVASHADFTDHRGGQAVRHRETRLYRFVPGGGVPWAVSLPDHGSIAAGVDSGTVTAPLGILHEGATTLVLVPALYRGIASAEARLVGVERNGAVQGDVRLGLLSGDVLGTNGLSDAENTACLATAGYWCLVAWLQHAGGFSPTEGTAPPNPDALPAGTGVPMPGVAVAGGEIVAADPFGAVVGLSFHAGSGFAEDWRLDRGSGVNLTGATLLPNGETVTAETDRDEGGAISGGHLLFTGPLETQVADAPVLASQPARTADGRIVFADFGQLRVFDGQTPINTARYPAATIASPSISRNDIFVSTASSLLTYQADTLNLVALAPWAGGGLSSPAIGAGGRVYALAGGKLYVFAGPPCTARCSLGNAVGGHAVGRPVVRRP